MAKPNSKFRPGSDAEGKRAQLLAKITERMRTPARGGYDATDIAQRTSAGRNFSELQVGV